MSITLTNSLTRRKEQFKPLDSNNIRMYVCGPTVNNRPHLGNARSAVVYDLLFRLLREYYPHVTYVRNITDVDDKIIAAARQRQIDIKQLTKEMTAHYHADMQALNCLPPTHEPKATEHIAQMISMINILIERGHAYVAEGHVLFAIDSYPQYGALARRNVEEMIAGSRVEVAPIKRNPMDFVLWKPAAVDEVAASFDSPWGNGRPGWHIECSVMSAKYLGEEFDIHGGGADLMFPHHENEIAQSCCAYSRPRMAHYWVHNGFLTINGEKMSKSLGNFKTVHDILSAGTSGWIIRFFYMTAHYRKPLDLTAKSFVDAGKALNKFAAALQGFPLTPPLRKDEELLEILADDMNTPKLLAKLHEIAADKKSVERLRYGLNLLGLEKMPVNLAGKSDIPAAVQNIPASVQKLASLRQSAKNNKDWAAADSLRQEIEQLGFTVLDMPGNQFKLEKK